MPNTKSAMPAPPAENRRYAQAMVSAPDRPTRTLAESSQGHTGSPAAELGDGDRLLRIVANISRIRRHVDLFRLLQEDDIQQLVRHEVLVSATGDFSGANLKFDIVSAIVGVRTSVLGRCSVESLMIELHRRWVLNDRVPLAIASAEAAGIEPASCTCPLHQYLRRRPAFLVHGVVDARDDRVSLYVLMNSAASMKRDHPRRFLELAELLVPQIDAASRRIAAFRIPSVRIDGDAEDSPAMLSAREEEILIWVSQGKTNVAIARILGISTFTVKNHLQRIMGKLGATNRTEAAAVYRQLSLSHALASVGHASEQQRGEQLCAA